MLSSVVPEIKHFLALWPYFLSKFHNSKTTLHIASCTSPAAVATISKIYLENAEIYLAK